MRHLLALALFLASAAHGQVVISQGVVAQGVLASGGGGGGSDIAVGAKTFQYGVEPFTTTGIDTSGGSASTILVACGGGSFTGTPITDSASNTWTAIFSPPGQESFGRDHVLYYCVNCTTSASHTFTCNADSGNVTVGVIQFNNAATASPISDTTSCTDTGSPYGCDLTTTTANVGIAAFEFNDSDGGTCTTSAGGSFTIQAEYGNTSGWVGASATRIVTSTGTYNPAMTLSGCSGITASGHVVAAVKD